ncbi:transposase [Bradyrhizobium liaoningense]
MFDPFSQQGAGELNVLKRHLQSTVLTLLDRNTSQREIHRLTGVDRKTIRRYQALRAGAEANSPGEVTTGSVSADGQIPPPRPPAFGTSEATVTSSLARSACEAHRTWIEEQVRLKRNAQAIYQDLVDQFGFPSSYQSVKRFVRRLRHADPEQFDRLEFLPGEEAQVDYGEGAPTVDPKSGRYRRPRLFVMTLRYSRRSFRRVVWKSSQQVWAQLHEEAFRYFGGVPSYVVLDNLKEGASSRICTSPSSTRFTARCWLITPWSPIPRAWPIQIGKDASRMRFNIPRALRWPDGASRRWRRKTSS